MTIASAARSVTITLLFGLAVGFAVIGAICLVVYEGWMDIGISAICFLMAGLMINSAISVAGKDWNSDREDDSDV